MLSWLTEPFSGGIMQRALVEAVVLGAACGPLGIWILLSRRAYAAESLSHAMLPGLVVAALVGAPLILGAAGGVLVAAAGIALVARDTRAGGDVGVAVVVSGLFGLGGILALSPQTPPRLGELLFGDLLGVTGGDLATAAVLSAGVLVALAAGHRSLSASAFDRDGARALGVSPARAEIALLALLAVTTVAAVQGLGNLLLVALVIAPAAAALNLASRLPVALALSAALAAVAGIAGLVISYRLEIATGASVALCAVALSSLALLKTKLGVP
jgi:ABC-type Mn2+/Zn2+ transport system permease subunit